MLQKTPKMAVLFRISGQNLEENGQIVRPDFMAKLRHTTGEARGECNDSDGKRFLRHAPGEEG